MGVGDRALDISEKVQGARGLGMGPGAQQPCLCCIFIVLFKPRSGC